MRRVSSVAGVAVALITMPLAGLPAWGAACPTALTPVTTFTTAGFSCNVDGVTFSNFSISPAFDNANTFVQSFTSGNENGLLLNYPAAGTVDVLWSFMATGTFIGDAFASLTGTVIGTGGSATLAETLLNNANTTVGTINLVLFPSPSPPNPPVSQTSLMVVKDQMDVQVPGDVTNTSVLIDAFSLVPGPIVGAGLPGLVAACGGLLALARRRRRQCA
jgi:hypothetical protein